MAAVATVAGNIFTPPLLSRLKLKPPNTPLLSLSSFQSNLFGLRLCITSFKFHSFPLSLSSSHRLSVSARFTPNNSDDDTILGLSSVRSDKVRLIDEQQNMVGVLSKSEAIRRAEDLELDLVVVSPDADPPVVRIMNYDKYRYEQQKKKREQQKKSAASRMDLKELKMGYNIDVHDYSVRLRAAQKFLKDGDKVKVIVNLKGRGNAFLEKAVQLIRKFQTELGECVAKDCPLCNGLLLLVCCVLIANCFLKTGEPQIICRPLGLRRKMVVCLELMLLTEAWSSAALYISAIVVMDPGKCIAVSDNKLNCQVDKLTMKISSSIDVLGPKQCEALEINGFSILCLDIKFNTEAAKCPKVDHIFSGLLQIHHVTDIRVCIDF